MTQEGISSQAGEQVWRFHDGSSVWRVSLAPTFLALETDSYTSRADFFDRFDRLTSALAEHVNPALWERLGVRYVDRVESEAELARLPDLVRQEVLGLAGTEAAKESLQLFINQAQFALEDGVQLLCRTGILPAGAGFDPTIQPSANLSWLLDLDMSVNGQFEFDAEAIGAQGRELAARLYRFFRWAVTPEFLLAFGASAEDLERAEAEA